MTGSQTPLETFRALRSLTVPLESGLALRVRKIDALALLDGAGDMPNPLLALVQQSMKPGQGVSHAVADEVIQDPAAISALRSTLDHLLERVFLAVILPDGTEIPGPLGGDLQADDFDPAEKMAVFVALMGGEERLAAAQSFLQEQASPVVAAPDEQGVRPEAVEDAGAE